MAALIVLSPRLIIVLRSIAKGAEHPFKVMLVLQPNVLLNSGETSRTLIFQNRDVCLILRYFLLSLGFSHR
jgi:hypothetical protein